MISPPIDTPIKSADLKFSFLTIPAIASDISPLISLVAMLYNPIARRRVAGLHYKFLPELRVAELLGFRGY